MTLSLHRVLVSPTAGRPAAPRSSLPRLRRATLSLPLWHQRGARSSILVAPSDAGCSRPRCIPRGTTAPVSFVPCAPPSVCVTGCLASLFLNRSVSPPSPAPVLPPPPPPSSSHTLLLAFLSLRLFTTPLFPFVQVYLSSLSCFFPRPPLFQPPGRLAFIPSALAAAFFASLSLHPPAPGIDGGSGSDGGQLRGLFGLSRPVNPRDSFERRRKKQKRKCVRAPLDLYRAVHACVCRRRFIDTSNGVCSLTYSQPPPRHIPVGHPRATRSQSRSSMRAKLASPLLRARSVL